MLNTIFVITLASTVSCCRVVEVWEQTGLQAAELRKAPAGVVASENSDFKTLTLTLNPKPETLNLGRVNGVIKGV